MQMVSVKASFLNCLNVFRRYYQKIKVCQTVTPPSTLNVKPQSLTALITGDVVTVQDPSTLGLVTTTTNQEVQVT